MTDIDNRGRRRINVADAKITTATVEVRVISINSKPSRYENGHVEEKECESCRTEPESESVKHNRHNYEAISRVFRDRAFRDAVENRK